MSSQSNLNFRKALVAFSQPGANAGVFRQAVEQYIRSYNKTVNQQVKNILSGTTYTNVNTRQKLLNRLAQQTSQAAKNARNIGMPLPQLNQKSREIKLLLNGLVKNFTPNSPNNIKWNTQVWSNLGNQRRYNKGKVNQILRNNYNASNPAFTKEIRQVLGIAAAPPPTSSKTFT